MVMKMQELVDGLESTSEDQELPTENILEFYKSFIPFSVTINAMAAKYNELREQLDNELKIRGIDLSNKP